MPQPELDASSLTLLQLRIELKQRGLSYQGSKADLIGRLEDAMKEEPGVAQSQILAEDSQGPLSPRSKRALRRAKEKGTTSGTLHDNVHSNSSARSISDISNDENVMTSDVDEWMMNSNHFVATKMKTVSLTTNNPHQEDTNNDNKTSSMTSHPPKTKGCDKIHANRSKSYEPSFENPIWPRILIASLLWVLSLVIFSTIFPTQITDRYRQIAYHHGVNIFSWVRHYIPSSLVASISRIANDIFRIDNNEGHSPHSSNNPIHPLSPSNDKP